MATLAPSPSKLPPSQDPEQQKKKRKQMWIERLLRSRYFLIAFLFHLVIFLLISTIVIFRAYLPAGDFEDPGLIAENAGGPPPPPPSSAAAQTETVEVPTTPNTAPTDLLAIDNATPDAFTVPVVVIAPITSINKMSTPAPTAPTTSSSNFSARANGVRGFTSGWGPGGNGNGPRGSGRSTQAEFTCYVAKYEGGDWAATLDPPFGERKGYRGSIPNLLKQTNEWSKGRIKASLVATPLKLSSQEIFEKKPPFIFFNGRKDFKLTDQEVENLRKYLVLGGAIWGDSALAGNGSRFDVAFRREMKRIIPDDDKPFEIVPDTHPIYNQGFFPLKGAPPGMNYYQEPLEMIRIDGEIAVLYTPNDYGDMMRMAFKDNTIEPFISDQQMAPFATPPGMWNERTTFYRGFEPEGAEETFKLGLNIIVHLLTRFQEKLNNS